MIIRNLWEKNPSDPKPLHHSILKSRLTKERQQQVKKYIKSHRIGKKEHNNIFHFFSLKTSQQRSTPMVQQAVYLSCQSLRRRDHFPGRVSGVGLFPFDSFWLIRYRATANWSRFSFPMSPISQSSLQKQALKVSSSSITIQIHTVLGLQD